MAIWNPWFLANDLPEPFRFAQYGFGDINVFVDPALHGQVSAAIIDYDRTIRLNPDFLNFGIEFWVHTLGHELGHALGYGDVTTDGCAGRTIMYGIIDRYSGPFSSYIESGDECALSRDFASQEPPPHNEQPQVINPGSPIIIDLDDDGFDLTGIDEPVRFDITGDGPREVMSWTAPAARDAFLVLDRNHNGVIDGGQELFGNATPLLSGAPAPHGFIALAEYDSFAAGGNGDGVLSSLDAIWSSLQMWVDANHDGFSVRNELASMSEAGVAEIETKYTRSGHRDPHGNLFRYKAKALVRDKHGRTHPSTVYDVFFVLQP